MESILNALAQFGDSGVVGICLILMTLLGGVFWMYYKTTTNHISHATDAFNSNTVAVTKLDGSVDNLTDAIDDLKNEIRSKK